MGHLHLIDSFADHLELRDLLADWRERVSAAPAAEGWTDVP